MKKKLSSAAALVLAAGAVLAVQPATAQESTSAGIEQYREMLGEGGNPAELIEMTGEELWAEKRGPKSASLEQCDLGQGPGVVKNAYAQLPRYFEDAGRVMDLESRLVYCMVNLQGMDQKEITKKPFSGRGDYSTDMEALVGYVVGQSRGTPLAVPQSHPQEKAAFERGKQIFFFRGGPYDFACASCHSVDKQRIRLQELPNLTKTDSARAAYTSWPAYRVSQGALRSMQWRLNDCFRQQRMPYLKYGSQASVDLTVFLAVNANGGEMAAPGLKR
ncbi:sulfur oxidation c-type cytochrome SoxA [Pollutimonas sp. H1-120]|uniref:sulfur oxidation c-type cytochrome SoxA n=1 Tax=Pollutimonas sp. H1-120 TaxID=3148824 RepID=UPI003B5198CD